MERYLCRPVWSDDFHKSDLILSDVPTVAEGGKLLGPRPTIATKPCDSSIQ